MTKNKKQAFTKYGIATAFSIGLLLGAFSVLIYSLAYCPLYPKEMIQEVPMESTEVVMIKEQIYIRPNGVLDTDICYRMGYENSLSEYHIYEDYSDLLRFAVNIKCIEFLGGNESWGKSYHHFDFEMDMPIEQYKWVEGTEKLGQLCKEVVLSSEEIKEFCEWNKT